MLFSNRVVYKLIVFIVLSFALTAAGVLLIANHRIKALIDESQAVLYGERLDTILNVLEHLAQRLEATGWQESYEEDFKKEAMETLASTYYTKPERQDSPFIVDHSGDIVLHPRLASGSGELRESSAIRRMLSEKNGDFDTRDENGHRQWIIFRYFKAWDWTVAYIVPFSLKYAQARLLRHNLALIMILIVLAVVLGLAIVIGRMIRPVTELTRAAGALAEGRESPPVTVAGNDEFAALAASFIRMRDAINEKIDELAAKNEALSESEERFRQLINQAADSVIVHDMQGRLLTVNRQACDSLGYTREELLTMTVMHIDEKLPALEDVTRLIEDLEVREPITFDSYWKRKDGSIFPVEMRLGLFESDDEKTVLVLARDVTARKRFEEQLREEKENFRVLVEGSPFGVSLISADGRYLYVNPTYTRIFGYGLSDIPTGKTWFEKAFPDPALREQVMAAWFEDKRQTRMGESLVRSFEVTCRDGTKKFVRFRPVALSNRNHLVIYEDITNQRRLETQLRQRQKIEAIGTLAGGIAHDFNNILSAVIGFAELALRETTKASALYHHLHRILDAGNRARNLVKQIMAFSRQSELELKPVDLGRIVEETVELLRATLPTTIEIHQYLKADALVMGDPTQMQQVLMNLCTNAGHAMREGGGILEIRLENTILDSETSIRHTDLKPGPYLCLSVSDTGHGMTPQVLERIFDPFFTTKNKAEGTGMGLAVSHGIVTSSGGSLYAYSEVGHGTTFKVLLPMVERRTAPELRPEPVITGGSERILFVDDEQMLVEIGKQMLETFGYDVTPCTSSIDAMNLFRSNPLDFDIVITDMTMPTMTGAALAKAIIEIRPGMPIILCTGFSTGITEETLQNLGIKALVMKPILMDQIADTVRRVLDESGIS